MTLPPLRWRDVCSEDEIQVEDLIEVLDADKVYVLYRTARGFFATSGLCTHEGVRFADGIVLGDIIECPRHQGQFHIQSGEAKRAPARRKLRTFPTKVEAGRVFIGLPDGND